MRLWIRALLARPTARRSLDFLQRHILHFRQIQKPHYLQQLTGKVPQRLAAGTLLLQVAEERLSFFQQRCLSVTIQEKGMFKKRV
jgi:hypothetical protein